MEIRALEGQSLFDIALMVYGAAEGAWYLALDNNLSLTDDLTPGQTLQYDNAKIINKQVVDYYRINGIKPATACSADATEDNRIFAKQFDIPFE